MALQSFANGYGTLIVPAPLFPDTNNVSSAGNMTAAGNSFAGVGYMLLSSGPGTSKTISSAGGKVFWATGAITWADAGTTLRVGIQDVGATGVQDGTFDVHGDLVPGTNTVTANAVNTAVMGSGTKTIAHGDLVAVVLTLTSRAGSDSVSMLRDFTSTATGSQPYTTINGTRNQSRPILTIQFDDGTVGYFDQSCFAYLDETSASFSSSSTPDEHALIFRVPFPCTATGLYVRPASWTGAADFELILYSDPLGSPVAERTLAVDIDLTSGNTAGRYARPFASGYNLAANTDYAIALRPTTTNGLVYRGIAFGTGNGDLRKATMLGTNWYLATRTNQTGAFGSADTTRLPLFGLWVGAFDDGAGGGGGGGGEVSHVFIG